MPRDLTVTGPALRLTPQKLSPRAAIVFVHDIVMAGLSVPLAFYLRLGDDLWWSMTANDLALSSGLFMAIGAIVFRASGLYRGVWRYASLGDLRRIVKAVSLLIAVFVGVMFIWARLDGLPRSVPVINWFVLMALLGGPRFIYRMFKDSHMTVAAAKDMSGTIPVLLAGAGDEAELFIRSLNQQAAPDYRAVGIVAETRGRVGREIRGVPVLGTFEDVASVVDTLDGRGQRPRRVILTREKVEGATVRALLDRSDAMGLALARLPRLTDFKAGVEDRLEVTPVAVEDLLGRAQLPLDRDGMARLIEGKRVMITGAGGSIGGELARQAAGLKPAHLCLVELSEFALYEIDRELGERFPAIARDAVIADVRDADSVAHLMAKDPPDLVFHAAALKHVPLVEANPLEGLMTNVVGTYNVAMTCRRAGVGAMVMISTDKAVNPTSVMGASKRAAEICCQALDLAGSGGTRFLTVRFGNVLGSTGSVVPLFQRQLAAGGPLTVTHPDMTRYFMTIREAVELVLGASALGAEQVADGRIFVLDMGEPVKIVDLARQMIRLQGLRPGEDVEIVFTGVRPGEKLFEDLFHGDEAPEPTQSAGVLRAAPRSADLRQVEEALKHLEKAIETRDHPAALTSLKTLVPEYVPETETATPGPVPQDAAADENGLPPKPDTTETLRKRALHHG